MVWILQGTAFKVYNKNTNTTIKDNIINSGDLNPGTYIFTTDYETNSETSLDKLYQAKIIKNIAFDGLDGSGFKFRGHLNKKEDGWYLNDTKYENPRDIINTNDIFLFDHTLFIKKNIGLFLKDYDISSNLANPETSQETIRNICLNPDNKEIDIYLPGMAMVVGGMSYNINNNIINCIWQNWSSILLLITIIVVIIILLILLHKCINKKIFKQYN